MTLVKNVALALAVLALAASFPASAGEAERKVAIELSRMLMPKVVYQRMVSQMETQILAGIKTKDGSPMPAELVEKVTAAVLDVLPYEELVAWSADFYQSRFSLEELGELTRFYQTPLGQKMTRMFPEIGAETGKLVARLLPERLPAAFKRHGLGP